MKSFTLALLIGGFVLTSRAVEIAASGISAPFFNEAGKLTHRMVAARGALTGRVRRLEQVEIHYFSLTEPATIVQKVLADEATWDEKMETLTGTRSVVVETEDNRLSGDGFDFALATSLLHIHRNFRMENREVVVTSDHATAELLVAKSAENVQVRDVKWVDAIGDLQIVVQPTATREYRFEKAFSDIAHYEGATQVVTLPNAIRAIDRKGQPIDINHMEIKVGGKKPPAPAH
jgi:hypothetical protein